MKKILAISAMIASLVALAGPKEDINKANDLFKKRKRTCNTYSYIEGEIYEKDTSNFSNDSKFSSISRSKRRYK